MKKGKRFLSMLLTFVMLLGCISGYVPASEAEAAELPVKVVVSVEGQTLGQGYYVEPRIVTFDEFVGYWAEKGQSISYADITAGGILSYVLQQNGTPMDYEESPSGPGYLSTVKGVDKGYTALPQFLADAGITLAPYDGNSDLGQMKYTSSSGWMFTEGNVMSNEALASHKLYSCGVPYEQNGEFYYVVRLQYTVDGLGADLGFEFVPGSYPYAYQAADKAQLYILFANLSQEGFFERFPDAKTAALEVMNTMNASQETVDAAYDSLLTMSKAEKPVFTTDLSEEVISYGVDVKAEMLTVEAAVSAGSLSYEWFSSADKVNWESLGEAGSDNTSMTPATDSAGTRYYKCVVTNYDETTGLSNTAESRIATVVTGVSTPVFEKNLSSEEKRYLTVNDAETLEVLASVPDYGTLSFQWYESEDKESWAPVDGEVSESYTPDITKVGTKYYKCRATNTYEGDTSFADSEAAMITVEVDVPEFVTNLQTTTYYPEFDEELTLCVEAAVEDGGDISYQWYSGEQLASDGSVDGMTPLEGACEKEYRVDTGESISKYYKVVATNTLQGQTVSAVSKWSRVELQAENPSFTQNLEDEVYYLIGEENPVPLEVKAEVSDGGVITYQWYESEEEAWSTDMMTPIEGEVNAAFVPDVKEGKTVYYACRATNTNRGSEVAADSNIIKTVVSCERPVITKDLESQVEYHAGDTVEPLKIEAEIQGKGKLSYQWYETDMRWISDIEYMEPIEGATQAEYVPNLNKAERVYACRVTNTEQQGEKTETSYTDSGAVVVTVVCDAPVITKDLPEDSIQYAQDEQAEALRVEASVEDGGTLSYQWFCNGEMIEGATERSFTPATDTAGTFEYWVTVTNTKEGITNSVDTRHATVRVTAKQETITTEEELRNMKPAGNYILQNDITLTEDWTPIDYFEGTLDGNGHTISNVVINRADTGGVGFFKTAGNGAVIKNLGIVGTVTQTGYGQAGGLVGQTKSDGLTISDCYVKADVNGNQYYHVGGLVGQMGHQGTIENSYFIGNLTGGTDYAYAGGLAGQTYSDGTVIRNSYTTYEKAVGDYARYDSINTQNNYCSSENDAHAELIPEDMDAFLDALNLGGIGEFYVVDKDGINDGYPILSWEKQKEEPGEPEEPDATVEERLAKTISYLENTVTDPVVDTLNGEWSVFAMARYGTLPETTKQKYLTNLYQTLAEKDGVLHNRKYTEYSRVALALTAMGMEPTEVNGYNILAPLAEFENVVWQGVNGPAWALIAFDSHNFEIPKLDEDKKELTQTTREKLIAYILEKQLSDGGWSIAGNQSDADMTAMVLQALAPYYGYDVDVTAAVERALETLSGLQKENGGFATYQTENLESAAQAVIALSSLDVNLLSDERFIKNGNSILDYLLSYQLPDGSFKHVPNDDETDAMSTDQGALALLAYCRAMEGKTDLFDLSDVQLETEDGEETPERIEAFREKMNQLPELKEIRIRDGQAVNLLLSELETMGEFEEKDAFRHELEKKAMEVELQVREVEALDADIWEKINPQSVTREQIPIVKALLMRYENLPEENKEYVKYRDDLLQAVETIEKLLKEDAQEEIKHPVDKNTGTTTNKGNNVTTVTNRLSPKSTTGKETTQEEQTSNLVKAEVKNHIVDKAQVEKIKGTDKNLQMSGKTKEGVKYTFTLNGGDVKTVKEIDITMERESKYDNEIHKLAEEPYILSFAQKGNFPGKILVETEVELEDGEYLFFFYNPQEEKAEYVQKIEVKDKKTRFLVTAGGTYFISKKASTKSVSELSEEVQLMSTSADTGALQKESKMPVWGAALIAGIGVIAFIGLMLYIRKKKRKEQ